MGHVLVRDFIFLVSARSVVTKTSVESIILLDEE